MQGLAARGLVATGRGAVTVVDAKRLAERAKPQTP
jgi:hypothetical protein